MRSLVENDVHNAERIRPYIGGEEINTSPKHEFHRYVIDFADYPLRNDETLKLWSTMTSDEKNESLRAGIVPRDYPDPVAMGWPELLEVLERFAKPQRLEQKDVLGKQIWWRFLRRRNRLYHAIAALNHVLSISRVSPHLSVAQTRSDLIYADSTVIFAYENLAPLALLQSRAHEYWARFFSSSMKDDLRYAPTDCFRTFPFPTGFETDPHLEATGKAYNEFRATLMIERAEGLTKTYNRFHDRGQNAPDIAQLRALHSEMDTAVLRAYGWGDLAELAEPEFFEQDADEGKKPKTRLDWRSGFNDEVF